MRKKTFITVFYVTISFSLCQPLYSWEKEYTHPALSQEATNISQIGTYLQNQLGYTAGLNTQLQIIDTTTPYVQDSIWRGMDPSITTRSILDWFCTGSIIEDDDGRYWPIRPRHHFHDPIRNAVLDNYTDHPDWDGKMVDTTALGE